MKNNFSPGTLCGPIASKAAPMSQSRLAAEAKIAGSAPQGIQKRYVGERFGGAKPAMQRGAVFCATLFLMGALQGVAHADDFTWKGTTSSDWNDGANWTRTAGTTRLFPNNAVDTALFPTSATANLTANISAPVTVNKLTFNANGYEVASAGQSLTLGGTAPTITVGPVQTTTSAVAATISATTAGTGFTKAGAGTLTLNSTNAFTAATLAFVVAAPTATNSGAIRLASDGALTGVTTINEAPTGSGVGRIELTGGISIGSGITINTGGRANTFSTTSILTNISGNNTWAGNININNTGGSYFIRAATGTTLTLSGNLTNSVSDNSSRSFTIGSDGGNVNVTNNLVNGSSNRTLGIIKGGVGTLTLTGENTYSAGTTIPANSGTVQVGNAGTTGTLGSGLVTNNSTLTFNRSDALTLNNVIAGTGNVIQNGSGTLTFPGFNTYSGGTIVNAGALVVTKAGPSSTQNGYVPAARTGTVAVGSNQLTATNTAGLTVGLLVNGGGVPSGTTITAIAGTGTSLTLSANATAAGPNNYAFNTAGNFNGPNNVTQLTDTSSLVVGQSVSGTGIAPGTTITSINSATAVTLSSLPTASAPGTQSLTFSSSGILPGTDLTVNGATFNLLPTSITGSQQTLNLANLTLTSGSTIGAALGNSPATSATIVVANAAKATGSITVSPGVISGASPTIGSYPVVTDANGGLLNTNASTASYNLVAPAVASGTVTLTATDTALVVNVSAPNTAPTLEKGVFSASLNAAFSYPIVGNDADAGDTLTYAQTGTDVLPGTVTVASNGIVSGTPDATGVFPFSVTVTDSSGATATARFSLTVVNRADGVAPRLTHVNIPASLTRDALAAINFTGKVQDLAPTGVDPSGVRRVQIQLRNSLGQAYNGTTFAASLAPYYGFNLGAGGVSDERDYSRALSFVPSTMDPGAYSFALYGLDVAGNYGGLLIPFTIVAPAAKSAPPTMDSTSKSASFAWGSSKGS